jgi:hypothetical protein
LPIEVYKLYQWGNGVWKNEEWCGMYFLNHVFLSLESALEIYQALTTTSPLKEYQLPHRRTNGEQGWIDHLVSSLTGSLWIREKWYPQLFPLLWDYDNRGCYAVLGNSEQQETAPILEVDFIDSCYGEYYIDFPSLTKMVQSEAECYEAGIYTNDFMWEQEQVIRRKHQDKPIRVWRSPDFV